MNKHTTKKHGFTLIELLVVISIVGVLSSVILAGITSARQKGQQAAGITFSKHTFSAYGAEDNSLFFDFNKGTGDKVDNFIGKTFQGVVRPYTAGSGNCESASTLSTAWNSETPTGSGNSILFGPGGADCVNFKLVAASTIPQTSSFTDAAWVYLTSYSTNFSTIISFGQGNPNSHFQISSNGTRVRYYANSAEYYISMPVLPLNKWVHVAVTGYPSGTGSKLELYINGKSVGETTTSTINQPQPISIGSHYFNASNAQSFKGYIDDVAIYPRSLKTAEIEKLYADGLTEHKLAEK